ncbi:hypothetical protein [Paracoccus sp. (in: a-proteobacteria)]|uniref:hypothetical protein n=1 Tax=Paracoccus sp. TaxID=267 RepID=UPI00396CD00B
MIRPDLRRRLGENAELIVFSVLAGLGLWVAFRGGWFFALVGGLMMVVAVPLAIGALRRSPFRRPVTAPGVVEIVEGAIRYYGATELGGEIALRDLTEIRLLRLEGRAHWRLRSQAGEALLVPCDAAGAAALADAFTALPGLDMGAVSAALAQVAHQRDAIRTVWRRPV